MPTVSNLIRDGDASDMPKLSILTEYHRVEGECQAILKEYYPGTVLEGQDLLKRVAAVVGLQLPKTVNVECNKV